MTRQDAVAQFATAARKVGAEVHELAGLDAVVDYIARQVGGALICPEFPSGARCGIAARLRAAGVDVISDEFRARAPRAAAGLSGANFAIAATGTVVLESTAEPVRLATTLPEKHFVLLDPAKMVPDSQYAVPLLRRLHSLQPQTFLAYITGPSRTADIERVLTIGVHGPKELHVLLCEGVSDDVLES